MRADRCILVFQGFLFIDEDLDILAQGCELSGILGDEAIRRRWLPAL
jgi:hypothetical protein